MGPCILVADLPGAAWMGPDKKQAGAKVLATLAKIITNTHTPLQSHTAVRFEKGLLLELIGGFSPNLIVELGTE